GVLMLVVPAGRLMPAPLIGMRTLLVGSLAMVPPGPTSVYPLYATTLLPALTVAQSPPNVAKPPRIPLLLDRPDPATLIAPTPGTNCIVAPLPMVRVTGAL